MDSKTIDALFSRFTMAYGTRFRDQWAGQPAEAVKRLWRKELDGIAPHRIRWALNHLPGDFPLNAMQFRDLCRKAPAPMGALALPEPWQRPSEAMLDRMRALAQPKQRGARDWVQRLAERERRGEHLGKAQRDALAEVRQSGEERCEPDESTT